MNSREVEALLGYFQAAYPRATVSTPMAVIVWGEHLADHDPRAAQAAAQGLVATSEWPPSISEILAALESRETASEIYGAIFSAISDHRRVRELGPVGVLVAVRLFPDGTQFVERVPAGLWSMVKEAMSDLRAERSRAHVAEALEAPRIDAPGVTRIGGRP